MSTSQSGILKRDLESAWLSIRRYSAHIPDPVNFQDFEIQVSNDQASMQEVRPLLDRFSAPRSQGVCRELILPDPRTRLLLESSSLAVDEMVGGCGITIPLCVREISSDSATVWDIHLHRILQVREAFPFLITGDFANYFEMIRFGRLLRRLESCGVESELAIHILETLRQCSVAPESTIDSHIGLPQIPDSCALVVGNIYLKPFEDFLTSVNCTHYRFMDDFFLGAQSYSEAQQTLHEVSRFVNSMGLAINPKKTHILAKDEIESWFHLNLHRDLDELELDYRFSSVSADVAHKRFETIYGKLATKHGHGTYEVALRRAYRVASLIRFKGLIKTWVTDLRNYPGSSDAIASFLTSLESSQAIAAVRGYLNDPLVIYQTPEIAVVAAVLKADTTDAVELARDILDQRVRTRSDFSSGLALLSLARSMGSRGLTQYSETLSRRVRTSSFVFRRYVVASYALCEIPSPVTLNSSNSDAGDLENLETYVRQYGILTPHSSQNDAARR